MVATTKKKKVDAPATSSISHEDLAKEDFEETPFWVSLVTMLGYGILFVVGHMRDFLRRNRFESSKVSAERARTQHLCPSPCAGQQVSSDGVTHRRTLLLRRHRAAVGRAHNKSSTRASFS